LSSSFGSEAPKGTTLLSGSGAPKGTTSGSATDEVKATEDFTLLDLAIELDKVVVFVLLPNFVMLMLRLELRLQLPRIEPKEGLDRVKLLSLPKYCNIL
jgi:hypothetical protein